MPVAHKLEVIRQDMSVVNVSVCPEVGVAMYKMSHFFALAYITTFPDLTFVRLGNVVVSSWNLGCEVWECGCVGL